MSSSTVDIDSQLRQDRAIRDSAKAVFMQDYHHLREDLAEKGVGSRLFDRVAIGATDVFDEAVEVADNNRGALYALLAAVGLWFARNPILSIFSSDDDDEHDDDWDDDDWDDEDDYHN